MTTASSTPAPPTVARSSRSRWSALGRPVRAALPSLSLLVALVVAWEVIVRAFDVEPFLVPAPSRVWRAFLEVRGTLPEHIRTTTWESLYGLAWACVVGVVLAVLIASVPFLRKAFFPILVVSQTVPMVALAPLLLIWFGFGMTPKVIVVALVGFFPIVISTVDGLTGVDREMVGLVRSMGANRWQELRHVRIPAALPAFFAGLKIASAYAVTGAVVGEWVGGNSGLGVLITRGQASYRVDRVFVAVALVSILSILLFTAVQLIARLVSPWTYLDQKEGNSQ